MEIINNISDLEIDVINELFAVKPKLGVDPKKITYDYYRNYEFWRDKFPKGWEYIPGFDKVIESIYEQNKDNSPLDEIRKRQENITLELDERFEEVQKQIDQMDQENGELRKLLDQKYDEFVKLNTVTVPVTVNFETK
jgi:uncharacterized membrane protein